MNSYTTDAWSGTVKFTCMCGYKKVYKAKNEEEINKAEDDFRRTHANSCNK